MAFMAGRPPYDPLEHQRHAWLEHIKNAQTEHKTVKQILQDHDGGGAPARNGEAPERVQPLRRFVGRQE
ncbi:hypothetical protein [Caenispirillum bisanense]|uniref:hypothetical protein n=1 Tax=Caenispirillum bisanense TaxID=414052 RepID=UPI0031E3AEE6